MPDLSGLCVLTTDWAIFQSKTIDTKQGDKSNEFPGGRFMLENVDLSKSLDKGTYKKIMPELRDELWRLQRRALEAGMPTAVVF